jgi:hypothetical protein
MRNTGVVVLFLTCACGLSPLAPSSSPDAPWNPNNPPRASNVSCASLGAADAAARDAAFDALTATTWNGGGCKSDGGGLPPTCTVLTLRRDGTYTLVATSDYTERDDAGSWALAADDATTGLLCLDGAKATPMRMYAGENLPSALRFRLNGATLSAGPLGFSAGEPLVSSGSAAALADVKAPVGFTRVAGHAWEKTNAFDRAMLPDEFTVDGAGRFTASWRGGACTGTGAVSWDKDTLVPLSDANACDVRNAAPATAIIGVSNEVPDFVAGVLVLYESAFRPKGAGGRNELFFDPYSDSLRVHGAWDGDLRANVATPIDFTFENRDAKSTRTFQKITITLTPPGGTSPITLAERRYSTSLAAGASTSDTIPITPLAAGSGFVLAIAIAYVDATQPYAGSRTFDVAISP